MPKKFFGVLAVVAAVVLGGTYYFSQETEEQQFCAQVITEARNPDTGEVREFGVPCDVPEGWDTLEGDGNEQYEAQGASWQKYRNSDLGISFDYRIDPGGYTLIERDGGEVGDLNILRTFVLMDTKEYQELLATLIPREGPPAMSVTVVNNPNHIPLETWVKAQTILSLYDPSQTLTKQTLGGVPTVMYKADGLYQNDMIVAEGDSKIYIISGAYNDPEDQIRTDFQRFVSSIFFF